MLVCHVSFPSFLIVGIVETPNKAPINDDPTLVYILSSVKLCATIKPNNIATLIKMNKVVRVFCLMIHPLVVLLTHCFCSELVLINQPLNTTKHC